MDRSVVVDMAAASMQVAVGMLAPVVDMQSLAHTAVVGAAAVERHIAQLVSVAAAAGMVPRFAP